MLVYYILVFLKVLLEVYSWVFFFYILFSWFPLYEGVFGWIKRFLAALCEPVYELILKFFPPLRFGFVDLSPLYVFLLIMVLQMVVDRLLLLVMGRLV